MNNWLQSTTSGEHLEGLIELAALTGFVRLELQRKLEGFLQNYRKILAKL